MTTSATLATAPHPAMPGLAAVHAAASAPARSAAGGAALALALHAAMLAQASSGEAAQSLVLELARRLGYTRVGLAWLLHPQQPEDPRLVLAAVSDGSLAASGRADRKADRKAARQSAGLDTPALRPLLAACAESFDQGRAVLWPEAPAAPLSSAPASLLSAALSSALPSAMLSSATSAPVSTQPPTIHRAHAALVPVGGSAAGVPLVAGGRLVGALCLERPQGPPISAAELAQLENLACLAAPLLALMRAREMPWPARLRCSARQLWQAAGEASQRRLRRAGLAAAVLALLALLWPWPVQVGGRARLEATVQRVLAAPTDGYVQQAHARAGDSVRAGQLLVELADQDLQLERQRWQSQLAQQLDALATAQARGDRAQLVLHQSRADEAQAQLELVDQRLQRSRLVAPFDGIVVQGDLSQQLGAPVKEGTELLTLAPHGRFRVIVDIDERDIGAVQLPAAGASKVGAADTSADSSAGTSTASSNNSAAGSGQLTLSALPWDTLPLRVTRISPTARSVEGRNIFEVQAELTRQPEGLRAGLQGQARIDAGRASPLLHELRRGLGALRLAWWGWWG